MAQIQLEHLTRVRIGKPDDEDEIFRMSVALHEENGIFPMSEAKVRAFFRRLLAQQDGVIGVIGEQGAIEGAICLQLGCQWYSEQLYLEEVFVFCLPEYRKSDNAKNLIEFAKACSLATGLPLMIGILSNQRTEAKIKLYERRLGPPAGAFFLHGCATGQQGVSVGI